MSKIISFIILSGLVLAAVAAFNVSDVNAREEIKFVQFSVLARDRANYGVDENPSTIPAVSPGIIEQKVKDTGFESNLPIIRYTSLPAANPATAHQDNNDTQGTEQEAHNNHANNGNGTGVNNGNGNANQNQNSNGNNGKEKEKEKEKGANSGSGAGAGNSNTNQNANSGDGAANSNDKASNSEK